MDAKYKCETCEFWEPIVCKRFAQTVTKLKDDHCGEHSEYRKDLFERFYGNLFQHVLKEPEHGQEQKEKIHTIDS